MASARDRVLAVAASGALFYFGTGMSPVPALTWLAPLPVLLLASRVPAWTAAGPGSWPTWRGRRTPGSSSCARTTPRCGRSG